MPFVMQAVGRMAAEPVLSQGRNAGWTKFRLLDNRKSKGEDVTEAVTFVAFGDLAEDFCSRIEKGQVVHAWGHQMTERWTDAAGAERVDVNYRLFEFIPGPRPMRARQSDAQGEDGGRHVGAPASPARRPPAANRPLPPAHGGTGRLAPPVAGGPAGTKGVTASRDPMFD